MASLARTACCRCREQKLRCSRELPSCDRCLRLNAVCEFPLPPDRKVLAAFRAQAKRRIPGNSNNPEQFPNRSNRESPASFSSNLPFNTNYNIASVDEGIYTNSDIQLSVAVQAFLQDVYFSCMFNSTLVFHRPSFSRAFQEGRLPRHSLLAIYASATIFLPPTSTITRQNTNLLRPLGDLRALGRLWAIRAGKEVLQDIDQPSFESVQTCEMLTLYWFSAGESQRNTMFSGIAYKAACTLGLDLKEPTLFTNETALPLEVPPVWLNAETARRCFWAVWFTQCVNSDHRLLGTSYDDRIMNLPLPLCDNPSIQDFQQHQVTLSNGLDKPSKLHVKDPTRPSIMAELMILILNWAKIRDLIRNANRVPIRDWLADLFELEGRLSTWCSRLPESFRYSKRNLYKQLVVNQQPVYVFVHALYHQCRLVLHSTLVPHFSGLHSPEKLPFEAISLSARIALKSAQGISEIGADLQALDCNPTQIAPFVGYCLYVSASIHITLLFSRDATLPVVAKANLISNLKLLQSMKIYWTNLERLWVRINVLYKAQTAAHHPSASEGITGSLGSQAHFSDLDRLAGEARDTGQLSEALADSVLDYTLRRLKPDGRANSRSEQELEKTLYPNDLSQLIDEDSTFPRQNLLAPMMRLGGQCYPPPVDQGNIGTVRVSPVSGPLDRMEAASVPLLPGISDDWWQLGLDSIQQPILPYDELFSLDFNV